MSEQARTLVRQLTAAFGVLLIVLAGLAALMHHREDTPVFHLGLLVVLGLLIIGAGIGGSRYNFVMRGTLLVFINTFLCLFSIEAASFLFLVFTGMDAPDEPIGRENTAYYQTQDWGEAYWQEFSLDVDYTPFVGWRRRPFTGETINVGRDGLRETPDADCQDGAYRVYMFGGSTIWGTGAPDWYTIPSFVQRMLAEERDTPVCVVNYGESAFVSTQGVIQLMIALQHEPVPDLVIFYDGINDVIAADQSGQAGGHQNQGQIRSRFNGEIQVPFEDLPDAVKLASMLVPDEDNEVEATVPDSEADGSIAENDLGRAIVEHYLDNYDLVSAWADQYGFAFYFFWQPVLVVGDKPLTPEEAQLKDNTGASLSALMTATYAEIAQVVGDYSQFHDISRVLDAEEDWLWIDFSHITPPGNEMVAQEMLRIIGES